MPETRVPKFCNVCGTPLIPSDSTTGFDPYTGDRLLAQYLTCPNPTITQEKSAFGSKVSKTIHPGWYNNAGVWTQ